MLVSRKCKYALRAVFELALRNRDVPVKVHEIAEAQQIPAGFLAVILSELGHVGVVQSRRGNGGGYMLGRPPEEVSVGEIIEAVQGQDGAGVGAGAELVGGAGQVRGDHAFSELWQNVSEAVWQLYHETRISDLIETEMARSVACASDYAI